MLTFRLKVLIVKFPYILSQERLFLEYLLMHQGIFLIPTTITGLINKFDFEDFMKMFICFEFEIISFIFLMVNLFVCLSFLWK